MASQFVNWIKSPAGRSYFFSTHFWGPVANWGLPIAALADMQKDESMISGVMSPTMAGYSSVFMAFAWQVQPRNYLLFACHATNATAQLIQTSRFVNYWYLGGKEKTTEQIATVEGSKVLSELQKSSQHVASTVSKEAQVASAALTTEAARLTNKVNDSAVQLDKTITDEAALIKSKGGSLLHQAEKKGHELLEVAEKQAAAAKAHAAAGGQDALDRARAIAEQSKIDLGLAKAEVKEEVKEVKKKGWLW